jgi:type IV secretion system protein VirD4
VDSLSRLTKPTAWRFSVWSAVTYGLWAVYVLWLIVTIFYQADQISQINAQLNAANSDNNGMPSGLMPTLGNPGDANSANIVLCLWGLVGAAGVAAMRVNPFHWVGGKRLIWGSFTLAMMLGRLVAGWLDFLLAAVPEPYLFLMAPPLLVIFGVALLMVAFFLVATFAGIIVGIPVMLFNQILQFDISLHIYRYKRRGLAAYITRFGYWLMGEEIPIPPDDSHGARFATGEEINKLYSPKGMAFGHVSGAPLRLYTDKHVLIMASTRSGKGVSLIIPHLLRYQGSAFVLDPKGENAKATGRQRAKLNDKVHYLDPFGISGKPKSRFNPLARFTPDNMEAESKALAAALFIIEERERDHWNAAGQQLLAAIILYVYASPDIPPEKKDLPTVRGLLLSGINDALNLMSKSTLADGLLADLAISFLNTPEKEFGSIISTTQRQTEILDNPYIIACLSASGAGEEVDFAEWHRGTMTVFLCLSAPKFPVFNRWLRLVLTGALDEMTDRLDPPALPVCFMLDELATLGHLPAVENAVGLAAGYGVTLVTVFQDVAQMRDLYKGRWASFIGNAGVRALFNLDDYETAEYWSKFIGGRLVETQSRQEDIYGLSKGQNVGETMRPLLSPDEIMLNFGSGRMIVLPQGERPVISDRVAYFNDSELKGFWDDPRIPTPESSGLVSTVTKKTKRPYNAKATEKN